MINPAAASSGEYEPSVSHIVTNEVCNEARRAILSSSRERSQSRSGNRLQYGPRSILHKVELLSEYFFPHSIRFILTTFTRGESYLFCYITQSGEEEMEPIVKTGSDKEVVMLRI